jgi:FPC/CPF motif-containing protein YcgG
VPTTTESAISSSPRRRRMSADLRSRLEADVAEIRAELGQLATKDDLENAKEDVKRHIDSRTTDILEAIKCAPANSSND